MATASLARWPSCLLRGAASAAAATRPRLRECCGPRGALPSAAARYGSSASSDEGARPRFDSGLSEGGQRQPRRRASRAAIDSYGPLPENWPEEVLRDEIVAFALMKPHPVTLEQGLKCLDPTKAAVFMHMELPIRYADRIRMIESIRVWGSIPELREVHGIHLRTFCAARSVRRADNLEAFTQLVRGAMQEQEEVVHKMALGMRRLLDLNPDEFDTAFVDNFLNGFLLNRWGSNVFMSQYLALVDGSRGPWGILDPRCNPAEVCRATAINVLDLCEEHTGIRPVINIELYTPDDVEGNRASIQFPYIPSVLRYIVGELLKNSCRATAEVLLKYGEAPQRRPISINICADTKRVAICISDQARGIPFDVGSKVWSYSYTTAHRGVENARGPSDLAGFGVGLPLSRLYAQYLGGSLDLISLPGFGTHAYLFLPRLGSAAMEIIPDMDLNYRSPDINDYAL